MLEYINKGSDRTKVIQMKTNQWTDVQKVFYTVDPELHDIEVNDDRYQVIVKDSKPGRNGYTQLFVQSFKTDKCETWDLVKDHNNLRGIKLVPKIDLKMVKKLAQLEMENASLRAQISELQSRVQVIKQNLNNFVFDSNSVDKTENNKQTKI